MLTTKRLKSCLLLMGLACTAFALADDLRFTPDQLNYWAYQKVQKPSIPVVRDRAWVKTFVLPANGKGTINGQAADDAGVLAVEFAN